MPDSRCPTRVKVRKHIWLGHNCGGYFNMHCKYTNNVTKGVATLTICWQWAMRMSHVSKVHRRLVRSFIKFYKTNNSRGTPNATRRAADEFSCLDNLSTSTERRCSLGEKMMLMRRPPGLVMRWWIRHTTTTGYSLTVIHQHCAECGT